MRSAGGFLPCCTIVKECEVPHVVPMLKIAKNAKRRGLYQCLKVLNYAKRRGLRGTCVLPVALALQRCGCGFRHLRSSKDASPAHNLDRVAITRPAGPGSTTQRMNVKTPSARASVHVRSVAHFMSFQYHLARVPRRQNVVSRHLSSLKGI